MKLKRMILKTLAIAIIAATFSSGLYADPSEQFTVGAPLPGAGTAINEAGQADSHGAFHINIPSAYTPGTGYYCVGLYAGGHHSGKKNKIDNSIGYFSAGVGDETRVFGSIAVHEKDWQDSITFNAQVELLNQKDNNMPAIAIACQDVFNNVDFSLYGTATYKVETEYTPVFLTAGYGGGRFTKSVFGGISVPIGDSANIAAEYDGFQFNCGVGFKLDGRFGKYTVLAGYNDKSGIMVGGSINF